MFHWTLNDIREKYGKKKKLVPYLIVTAIQMKDVTANPKKEN